MILLFIIFIFILFWLFLGLIGYSILESQYMTIFKVEWKYNKRTNMRLRILLGPICLIWSILEYYSVKSYWEGVWKNK